MCTGPSGAGGGGTGVPSSHFSPESKAAVSGDGTASSGLGGYANASAQGFGKGGPGPNIPAPKSPVTSAPKKNSSPSPVSTADQRTVATAGSSKRKGSLATSTRPSASTPKTSPQGLMSTTPTAKKSLLGH